MIKMSMMARMRHAAIPALYSARYSTLISFLLLFLLATPALASTEKRVALVIGNGAYQHVPRLPNPGNDVRGVAAALKRLGFDVTTVRDAGKSALEGKLAAFRGQSRGANLAVLYYAGHAVQIEGRNYIVPVDAEVRELGDVSLNLVTLNAALQQMEGQVNVVILDACRDNSFADDLRRSAARLGRTRARPGVWPGKRPPWARART